MNLKLREAVLISGGSLILGGILGHFITDYFHLKTNLNTRISKTNSEGIALDSQTKSRNNRKTFNRNDPFDQIDRLHDQMRKRTDQFFGRSFGSSFGNSLFDIDPFSGSSFTMNNIKIKRYEDSEFKYIEIFGPDVNEENFEVSVSNGMVSISGEVSQIKTEAESSSSLKSQYSSKFHQSFNIPDGVDEHNVKIESNENEIIIKFPKDRI